MTHDISDEILTAFLDGELDTVEHERVEAALASDADLAARLAALDLPMADLRAGFDDLLTAAPPLPEPARRPVRRRSFGGFSVAAALVLGLMIGGAWSLRPTPAPKADWKMAVANYQNLYVAETLAEPADPADTAARLQALSAQLGRDLSPASAAPGLEFRRVQMLGLKGKPLVQMAYLAEGGVPFALCIIRNNAEPYAPEVEVIAGLATAHWAEDGFGFLIIGGEDLPFVGALAEALQGRI